MRAQNQPHLDEVRFPSLLARPFAKTSKTFGNLAFAFESRVLGSPPTTGGYSEPLGMRGDPYQKMKHLAGPDCIPERYRESAKENMENIAPSAGFSPAWSPVYRGPPRGGCKRGRINKILQKSIVCFFFCRCHGAGINNHGEVLTSKSRKT